MSTDNIFKKLIDRARENHKPNPQLLTPEEKWKIEQEMLHQRGKEQLERIRKLLQFEIEKPGGGHQILKEKMDNAFKFPHLVICLETGFPPTSFEHALKVAQVGGQWLVLRKDFSFVICRQSVCQNIGPVGAIVVSPEDAILKVIEGITDTEKLIELLVLNLHLWE